MRQKFLNFITLKGFSKATIRTYLSLFDIIISDDENIFNKSEDEIISYLAKKIQVNDYSDSYVAQYVSVFNIVIRDLLKREDKIKIPRPKKAQKQPDILSVEEVKSILDNIENILSEKPIECKNILPEKIELSNSDLIFNSKEELIQSL